MPFLTVLGRGALVLIMFTSVCSAAAALWGARTAQPRWVRRAERSLLATAGLFAAATLALLYLLVSRDFRVQYVYAHTSTSQPTIYVVSALWAGQEGSLLLWALLVGAVTVTSIALQRGRDTAAWPYALGTLAGIQAFFALMLVTVQNPFFVMSTLRGDGLGILPTLENPAMVVHPPILFLGYAAYSVPFAWTMAQLLCGASSSAKEQIQQLRRWSIVAWLFLGAGILIGAWWAYTELGWGGYWSWDPVESASLLPWLSGTALLHSLLAQERHGMFKRWNATLPVATFLLCMFATLATRGGLIISDLHGFSQNIQPVAYLLMGFIAVVAMSAGLLLWMRRATLCDDEQPEQLLSRGSAILVTNLVFLGLAGAILLGILFPNLSQSLWGMRIHLSRSFYDRVFAPLAAVIILLIAICPVLGWRRSSWKTLLRRVLAPALVALATGLSALALGGQHPFTLLASALIAFAGSSTASQLLGTIRRGRRRRENGVQAPAPVRSLGAQIVHLAILLMAVGILGSSVYKVERLEALSPGQCTTIQNYTLEYQGLEVLDEPARRRHIATLEVYRGNLRVATLRPERNFHWNIGDFVSEVSTRSTLMDDLYVALGQPGDDGSMVFRVSIYPLVAWLWIGGTALLLGALIAVWPTRSDIRTRA
jgi:cytochrome c-type biogenesis protein CcmF